MPSVTLHLSRSVDKLSSLWATLISCFLVSSLHVVRSCYITVFSSLWICMSRVARNRVCGGIYAPARRPIALTSNLLLFSVFLCWDGAFSIVARRPRRAERFIHFGITLCAHLGDITYTTYHCVLPTHCCHSALPRCLRQVHNLTCVNRARGG